jgi:hypothetical protein
MDSAFGIARQYVEQFLGTQKSQADALSRLAACVEHRDTHESFEHQEMLIALKALHRDLTGLRCREKQVTIDDCRLPIEEGALRESEPSASRR